MLETYKIITNKTIVDKSQIQIKKTEVNESCKNTKLFPEGCYRLVIYKSKELESTFIEIVKPNKKDVIIGCIYRHPNMDLSEFNNHHILPMLAKLE